MQIKWDARYNIFRVMTQKIKELIIIIIHLYFHDPLKLVYSHRCMMQHVSVFVLVIKVMGLQEMEDGRDLPEKVSCYEGVFYNYFSIGWPFELR